MNAIPPVAAASAQAAAATADASAAPGPAARDDAIVALHFSNAAGLMHRPDIGSDENTSAIIDVAGTQVVTNLIGSEGEQWTGHRSQP
jgi:hypothetical protein